MKTKIAVILAVLVCGMGIGYIINASTSASTETKPKTHQYASTAVVTAINVKDKEINCIDFNGNEWFFHGDPYEWQNGEIVSLIMNDNGTSQTIYDDKIVSVKYSGWLDGNWGWTGNEKDGYGPILNNMEE